MEFLEGTYKSEDGKDYYELALNLQTKEKILIKNASCTATAMEMACEKWNIKQTLYSSKIVKIFFCGADVSKISEKIPKKYQKLVFDFSKL